MRSTARSGTRSGSCARTPGSAGSRVARAAGIARPIPRPDRGWRPAPVERDAPASRARARCRPSGRALYPNTGPLIRDRTGADAGGAPPGASTRAGTPTRRSPSSGPVAAGSMRLLHERMRASLVSGPSSRPSSGASEQLIRWSGGARRESLPSWEGWDRLGDGRRASTGCSIVRRTRATRADRRGVRASQLRAAYPAHTRRCAGRAHRACAVARAGARLVPRRCPRDPLSAADERGAGTLSVPAAAAEQPPP